MALPSRIKVTHGDVFEHVTGDTLDSAAALDKFPELRTLVDDGYRFVESVEDLDLYRRK